MNADDIAAWAGQHKPVVIGGALAGLLGVLYLAHKHAQNNAAASTAGATTADSGQYLVPYDTSSDGASGGGITTGDSGDIAALTAAITGLTTSVDNLDPATGDHNNGTDGGGGGFLHGSPVYAKPTPVHAPVHPHPPTTTTGKKKPKPVTKTTTAKATHNKPPKKQAAKSAPPKKKTPPAKRAPVRKAATPNRPVVRPLGVRAL